MRTKQPKPTRATDPVIAERIRWELSVEIHDTQQLEAWLERQLKLARLKLKRLAKKLKAAQAMPASLDREAVKAMIR